MRDLDQLVARYVAMWNEPDSGSRRAIVEKLENISVAGGCVDRFAAGAFFAQAEQSATGVERCFELGIFDDDAFARLRERHANRRVR